MLVAGMCIWANCLVLRLWCPLNIFSQHNTNMFNENDIGNNRLHKAIILYYIIRVIEKLSASPFVFSTQTKGISFRATFMYVYGSVLLRIRWNHFQLFVLFEWKSTRNRIDGFGVLNMGFMSTVPTRFSVCTWIWIYLPNSKMKTSYFIPHHIVVIHIRKLLTNLNECLNSEK